MNTKRFVNFRYIFYPFLMFLYGIIVARSFYAGVVETLVVVLLSLLILGGLLIYKKKYKILALLFAFFFLGNGFYFLGEISYKVKDYHGQVAIVARVSDSFEENDYYYMTVLDNVTINGESAKNIEATFSKGDKTIKVGDILTFESEVTSLPLFTLGSLNTSTYRSKIGYSLSASTSDLVITTGYTYFDEDIRLKVKSQLYDNMSEGNAGIAYAVLFGDSSGISYEINEAYRNSGIIHILTVSGLNVSFLIALIYGFLKLCKANKYVNFTITILILLIYAYLCGFAPSVVRATIMGIVVMLGKLSGRRYDALNSTGLAGFIILICSPLTAFDTGFLMSIACVCGIVLLYSPFYKSFKKCMPNWTAQYNAVSLSAQIAILPFLASFSSNINLLSFVINLFVVPIFAVVFPYLFVCSIVCMILPFMSFAFTLVEWGLVTTNFIASIFSRTSLQFTLTPMHLSVAVAFFLILFTVGKYLMAKPMSKFLLCSVLIFCMTFSFGFTNFADNIRSGTVYLSAGGEECVMLLSSGGQKLMIGENYLAPRFMAKHDIDKLDYYLSFDPLYAEDTSELEEYGFTYYCTPLGDTGKDDIVTIIPGVTMQAGDFSFTYLAFEDELLGIYLSFDATSLFVASETEIDYNILVAYQSLLEELKPDIVFLGDKTELAGDSFISVSSVIGETSYNYIDDGNLLFLKSDNGYSVRRLD